MRNKKFFTKLEIIAITFSIVACGAQPSATQLATVTQIPPTGTPTLTPTSNPTNTPTITPTPIGGSSGLLLYSETWSQDITTGIWSLTQEIYAYDINSQKVQLFLEGYFPAGVSPDLQKVLVQKNENEKTSLFIVDLAKPEQMLLLHENVEEAVWFPDTDWIGFISLQDKKRQVFIIHPDGSDLTQVTESSIGAVVLEPAFNDGVFWGEGTVNSNGSRNIHQYNWTQLNGTETSFVNFHVVAPDGNFVITSSQNQSPSCFGCNFELVDLATSERRDILLNDLSSIKVNPLSDDKWAGRTYTTEPEDFIISSDGTILLNFADLPHSHDLLPNNIDMGDTYDLIGAAGGNLSGQRLSPDGNFLMIDHRIFTTEESTFSDEISYYLLNFTTFELQQLSGLLFTREDCIVSNNRSLTSCSIEGFRVDQFFWIEMP